MNRNNPRILITSGEPAGIGPDIILEFFAKGNPEQYDLTVIADPELLSQRAKILGLDVVPIVLDNDRALSSQYGLKIIPLNLAKPVVAGRLEQENVRYLLDMLQLACKLCEQATFDALVTAPLQKSLFNQANFKFTGHTEYFSEYFATPTVMLLAGGDLRVALVTTHLPLSQVANSITQGLLEQTLHILIQAMRDYFDISRPRITVCGLNPHAGEDGYLGTEEQAIIIPLLDKFRQSGIDLTGPLPADTAFQATRRKRSDVFLCMYHDQGLPVLKTLSFNNAVNITLGLPIIRTSVDHGTALALAGTGKANYQSLATAIDMAANIALQSLRAS